MRQPVEASKDAPVFERARFLAAKGDLYASMGEREKAVALLDQAQKMLEEEHQRLHSRRPGPSGEDWSPDNLTTVSVTLGNVKVQHASVLFRSGKKGQARQLCARRSS